MRDKVKRFISILMTALMLVNLMPVGALADGITSIGYKPEVAASTGNYTVYVYARFDGDPLPGVTLNGSQWYSIGYIKDVNLPSPGGISWGQYWYYNNNNYCGSTINSTSASGIIGGLVQEYNTSIVIKSDEWISANFKACPGADTYKPHTSEPTWHLDIIVDINKNPPVHNLVFKVNNSNGKQIGTPKKVTGRWTNPLWANKYYAGNPVPETIIDGGRIYQLKTKREGNPNLDTRIYFDEPIKNVEFYYKDMGPVKRNYTVNYYLNGTEEKVKTSTTGTKELGETVTPDTNVSMATRWCRMQKTSLTIVDGDNVLNLYYYKNVELTANSKTETYDGTQKSVSGFTGAPKGADFSAIEVGVSGTDAGTYDAIFPTGTKGTVDATGKYIVTKAINGTLKITPVETEVVVKIAGNTKTETYNGKEHSVEGYTVTSISNPLYTANDFTFTGTAEAKGTDAGTYPMGLTADQFTNNKSKNFSKVTFEVADGWLKIDPVETEVFVKIAGKTKTETYNGKEHSVEGYTVTSISNPLYTANDFTFTGTAEAKGTDAGTYPMGLTADQFTNNKSKNFSKVTFEVADGWLKIDPVETEVFVKIAGKTKTETYNGKEHSVEGYTVTSISNPLYTANDFTFSGTAEAKGTDAGTYPMGLTADQFTNNKSKNFSKVTFEVADGWLKIDPVETEVFVKIAGNTKTETYNGKEHNVEGYTVTSISNPLYTANDFTFTGTAEAKGTNAGTYQMGLTADQFTNNKSKNFSKVTFEVADGWLKIDPVETEVFVKIAGNTKTETYNGKEHSVEGYTVTSISNTLYTANDFTFSGTAEAKGTDAGTYPMGLTADQFTNNKSKNFSKVTFEVADGWLKIDPVETEVFVKIAGNTKTETYNGKEHSVEGYTVTSISNPLYTANDFTFTGTAEAKGTNAGTYQMGLTADQFTNNKSKNFSKVTFEVADGWLKIDPVETEVFVKIAGNTKTETYNGKEHSVEGYTVTSISNTLYTANDFTFSGTAEAKGTDAGTYPMGLTADQFTNNKSKNFSKVTFEVADGWLKIDPVETEVFVKIAGNTKTETYNGKEHSVEGYTVTSISNTLYTANDFTFSGTAEAKGTDAGTYPMGLTADQFTNNKSKNFSKVTFEVADGWLKIDPVETEVFVKIAGNTKTETYNGKEHNVEGYTVTSISNDLYTEDDFEFTGEAKATGTEAGTYYMGLTAADFTNNDSTNFSKVTFVVEDGWLKINPIDEVTVTITGKTKTETYNGNPYSVEGYTVTSISNDLYTEDDFEFTGEAKATGTEAGTYYMGLTAADFTNNDSTNFSKVTFVVEDGWLKINPIDEVTVTITEKSGTVTYDGGDHIVSGYKSMTAEQPAV